MLNANPAIRFHRFCIGCGVVFGLLFFAAITIMGIFPPPAPLLPPEEFAATANERLGILKIGIPLGMLAAGLSIPYNCLIAVHIARIEMSDGGLPVVSLASFCGGTLNTVFFFVPFALWTGLFYRIGSVSPDVVRMINDISWLTLINVYTPAMLQMFCIAIGGFLDKSENPVFPRWCCFTMIWLGIGTVTGCLSPWFYDGPFAWNGIIGFWIPATSFGIWLGATAYCMWKYTSVERTPHMQSIPAA